MAENAVTRRHAQSRARNKVTVQLCQPPPPKSRVRGVVAGRVLPVRALLIYLLRLGVAGSGFSSDVCGVDSVFTSDDCFRIADFFLKVGRPSKKT